MSFPLRLPFPICSITKSLSSFGLSFSGSSLPYIYIYFIRSEVQTSPVQIKSTFRLVSLFFTWQSYAEKAFLAWVRYYLVYLLHVSVYYSFYLLPAIWCHFSLSLSLKYVSNSSIRRVCAIRVSSRGDKHYIQPFHHIFIACRHSPCDSNSRGNTSWVYWFG